LTVDSYQLSVISEQLGGENESKGSIFMGTNRVVSVVAVVVFLLAVVLGWQCQGQVEGQPAVERGKQVEDAAKGFAEFYKGLAGFGVDISSFVDSEAGVITRSQRERFSFVAAKPNQLAMVLRDGTDGATVVGDGVKVSSYLPVLNQCVAEDATKDFGSLFGGRSSASAILQMTLPLVDVLLSDKPYEALMRDVSSSEYLGEDTIGDVKCRHLKFVQKNMGREIGWELWLEAGEKPWLRRISTQISAEGASFKGRWEFENWRVNEAVDKKAFVFEVTAGVKKVSRFSPASSGERKHRLEGKAAPEFKLALADGGTFDLSAFKGKQIVMLDFWASYCQPCRESLPMLERVAGRYKDKGVVFCTVNATDDAGKIKSFLNSASLHVPVAIDKERLVSGLYEVSYIPHSVIIGKDGVIKKIHIGAPANEESVAEDFEDLLNNVDLSCGELSFVPEKVKAGDKVSFRAVIKNNGSKEMAAGTYIAGLLVDGQQIYSGPVQKAIAPGGTVEISIDKDVWHFSVGAAGSHECEFRVDPDNSILETDEGNNGVTKQLAVN
jgi:peroxiredoxin